VYAGENTVPEILYVGLAQRLVPWSKKEIVAKITIFSRSSYYREQHADEAANYPSHTGIFSSGFQTSEAAVAVGSSRGFQDLL